MLMLGCKPWLARLGSAELGRVVGSLTNLLVRNRGELALHRAWLISSSYKLG